SEQQWQRMVETEKPRAEQKEDDTRELQAKDEEQKREFRSKVDSRLAELKARREELLRRQGRRDEQVRPYGEDPQEIAKRLMASGHYTDPDKLAQDADRIAAQVPSSPHELGRVSQSEWWTPEVDEYAHKKRELLTTESWDEYGWSSEDRAAIRQLLIQE